MPDLSSDQVVLMGTKGGPAIRPGSSMPTSNLLILNNQRIVVDCGLGVTKGLVDQGMQLRDLSLIVITHMHSDHYLELGPLIHTAWTAGLKSKVVVYGPTELAAYWDGFIGSMKADIDLRIADEGRPDLRELLEVRVIDAGTVLEHHGITISAIRTAHPPLVDCFALSFKTPRRHVVFSGDTAPIEAMVEFAKGADLLIHEAMLEAALPALFARIGNGSEKLMDHWLKSHSFAHDAAQIAARAGVKRLALTHLIPSDDPEYGPQDWQEAVAGFWDGPLVISYDGVRITL